MDDLLMHPATRRQLDYFISRPVGALLLSGPAGSGKSWLSINIAARLLATDRDKLTRHPYFIHIKKPDNKSEIPIELIRELIKKLGLKVPSGDMKKVSRVVYIEDAHFLSAESQNALLKLLEEPPDQTVFILNVTSEDDILPTVISRTQKISILPPSLEDCFVYYPKTDERQLESAWRLSQGGAGLLSALLNESDHPLKNAVAAAKTFLSQDRYSRLNTLKQLGGKESLGIFLDGLSRVLSALQAESVKKGSRNQQKLLDARQLVNKLIGYHEKNVNIRLISLMLANDLSL